MSLDILKQELELAMLRGEAVHLTPQTVLTLLEDAEDAYRELDELDSKQYEQLATREKLAISERNAEFAEELRGWLSDLRILSGHLDRNRETKLTKKVIQANLAGTQRDLLSLIKELERYCAKL
jgi:hypothetical protein